VVEVRVFTKYHGAHPGYGSTRGICAAIIARLPYLMTSTGDAIWICPHLSLAHGRFRLRRRQYVDTIAVGTLRDFDDDARRGDSRRLKVLLDSSKPHLDRHPGVCGSRSSRDQWQKRLVSLARCGADAMLPNNWPIAFGGQT